MGRVWYYQHGLPASREEGREEALGWVRVRVSWVFVLLPAQMVTSPTESGAPINYDITKSERNNNKNVNHFDENKVGQGSDSGPSLGCEKPKEAWMRPAVHVSHPGEAAVCTNTSSMFLTYKCCPLVEPHRVQAALEEALAG